MAKDKNYKHYRILDFNPDICGVEDGYIVLFSPYKLIVDGVLVIPDGKTITGKNSVGTRLVESIGEDYDNLNRASAGIRMLWQIKIK